MPTRVCVGLTYLENQAVLEPKDVDDVESTFILLFVKCLKSERSQHHKT